MGSINFAAPFQLLKPGGAAATQYPQQYDMLGALAQIVPVRFDGLERVMHCEARWPARGSARMAFGTGAETGGRQLSRTDAATPRSGDAVRVRAIINKVRAPDASEALAERAFLRD
jgi:hypothetical protein